MGKEGSKVSGLVDARQRAGQGVLEINQCSKTMIENASWLPRAKSSLLQVHLSVVFSFKEMAWANCIP